MTSISENKMWEDTLTSLRYWRVWIYLGKRDITTRFKRTLLGPIWIFLQLIMLGAAVGVIYGLMFNQDVTIFIPSLLAGVIVWGLLVSSFTEGGMVFVSAEGYIKQFPFPKQVYLLRCLVSNTIQFFIGLLVLIAVLLFFRNLQLFGLLIAIPGIVILMLAALVNISCCAYLGTVIRDLPHALGAGLQVVFYVTPIIYPAEILKRKGLEFIYQVNPFYHLIEIVRHPILSGEPAAWINYQLSIAYILTMFVVTLVVARRLDSKVVFLL